MRETPLREAHENLGARLVDFAGWYMPVTYTSIKEEHLRVRTKVGLFDVSHMGRFMIAGRDHIKFADHILSNRRADMKPGRIRYSLILNRQGGVLDDVLVYAMGDEGTMLVVNAGNRKKIWDWIANERKGYLLDVNDLSDEFAMIALQGPKAMELLSKISEVDTKRLKYYRFTRGNVLGHPDALVSRTGYTGEDGYELIVPSEKATYFWNEILELGAPYGAGPIGLGARDTLRLEAGMPLYGHEINETTNPLEAGLDWAVKLDKDDFIGKEATLALQKEGIKTRLVGFIVASKRIPRQGQELMRDGRVVGRICSGTKAPWVDSIIATGYVPAEASSVGTKYQVTFRGKVTLAVTPDGQSFDALIVPLPFYTRPGKKKK